MSNYNKLTLIGSLKSIAFLSVATLALTGPAKSEASDWPQWQGSNRDAKTKETGLLQSWPENGPDLAWRAESLGGGDGTPSIANGRIYGMGNRGEEEVVWALSEKDGSAIWTISLGAAHEQMGWPQGKEGPGSTPTVDGDHLYVLGLGGRLACLKASDGSVVWEKNLVADFDGKIPSWSYRESPLVDGDQVICTPGSDSAMMVALNKKTGETLWKTEAPEAWKTPPPAPAENQSEEQGGRRSGRRGRGGFGGRPGAGSKAGYASAIAINFEGSHQYVQLTAKGVVGVSAKDGKLLWQYDAPANRMGINCSTPIFKDGMIFAASAYGNGGGTAKLSRDENGNFSAEEIWFSKDMENHHGGVLLIDGALYGANGGNGGGYMICLDHQTGEILWNEKDREKRRVKKGSVAYADGRIYYREEEGDLILIEPSREDYLERGRFTQPDRTSLPAWSHPVVANGKLYVRDQHTLFCYDVKK